MLARLEQWFGPIILKDGLTIARRRQYYALRLLTPLLILASFYVAERSAGPLTASPFKNSLAAQSKFANRLVTQFIIFQSIAIVALTPILYSGTIAEERANGAFDLLRMTHLSAKELVIGKLASRLTLIVCVQLAGAPILLVMMLLGGVSFEGILLLEIGSFLLALCVAAGAMYAAVSAKSPAQMLALPFMIMPFAASFPASFLYHSLAFANAESTHGFEGATLLVIAILAMAVFKGILNQAIHHWSCHDRDDGANPSTWSLRQISQRQIHELEAAATTADDEETAATAHSALWAPLRVAVDRHDPPLRENLWVFGVLLLGFAICCARFYVVDVENAGIISGLLIPLWFLVTMFEIVVSVSNPLFTRRPGFFDLLLQTPIDAKELLWGSLLVCWPILLRAYVAVWLIGGLWILGNPWGIFFATLIGTMLGALLLAVGAAGSLLNNRLLPRLGPALALFLGAYGFSRLDWRLAILFVTPMFVFTTIWTRHRLTPTTVAAHFLTTYLAVTSLFVVLPAGYSGMDLGNPAACLNPPFWFIKLLWIFPDNLTPSRWRLFAPGYALSLGVLCVWAWDWTIQNFDRLVGRR